MKLAKKWLLNKYFLTPFGLLVWLLFFDSNDIISLLKSKAHLSQLKEEKVFYAKKIEESKRALHELSSDKQSLEKFAREKYYMKRENEEIFLIIEED